MSEPSAGSSPILQKVNHLLNVKYVSQKPGWKYDSWIRRILLIWLKPPGQQIGGFNGGVAQIITTLKYA